MNILKIELSGDAMAEISETIATAYGYKKIILVQKHYSVPNIPSEIDPMQLVSNEEDADGNIVSLIVNEYQQNPENKLDFAKKLLKTLIGREVKKAGDIISNRKLEDQISQIKLAQSFPGRKFDIEI